MGRRPGANINHKILIFFSSAADQMLLCTFIFKYFLTGNPSSLKKEAECSLETSRSNKIAA